jgi:hypothetical protein
VQANIRGIPRAGTSSFWDTSWGATVADESAEALVLFASTISSSYHLNLAITARHISDQPCDHRNCFGVEPTIWQNGATNNSDLRSPRRARLHSVSNPCAPAFRHTIRRNAPSTKQVAYLFPIFSSQKREVRLGASTPRRSHKSINLGCRPRGKRALEWLLFAHSGRRNRREADHGSGLGLLSSLHSFQTCAFSRAT